MTDLLTRAASWLIAPREDERDERDGPTAASAPSSPTAGRVWLAPTDRHERDQGRSTRLVAGRVRVDAPSERFAPAPAAVGRVVVLGPVEHVPAVAASVGLALRRRSAGALILSWPPDGRSGDPVAVTLGLPGARLLVGRLARRGLPARAHGRLVWVSLPASVEEAEAAAGRAEAAANGAPSVLAVTAPRGRDVDRLIAHRDLVVVAMPPESSAARIAVAELAALGLAASAVAPPEPGPARLAALAGLRPHLPRSALIAAVEAAP